MRALPFHWVMHRLPAVIGRFLAALIFFVFAPQLLGCWSEADAAHMRGLHDRFGTGRPRLPAKLLEWAGRRAAREAA